MRGHEKTVVFSALCQLIASWATANVSFGDVSATTSGIGALEEPRKASDRRDARDAAFQGCGHGARGQTPPKRLPGAISAASQCQRIQTDIPCLVSSEGRVVHAFYMRKLA